MQDSDREFWSHCEWKSCSSWLYLLFFCFGFVTLLSKWHMNSWKTLYFYWNSNLFLRRMFSVLMTLIYFYFGQFMWHFLVKFAVLCEITSRSAASAALTLRILFSWRHTPCWSVLDFWKIKFKKSSLRNQVKRTGFLVYFEISFCCLCSLQKSSLK